MENKVRKIGRPLWNQIFNADESEGWAMCDHCDCIESGFPELYDGPLSYDVACPNCTIGVMEPTGDLIVAGELTCEEFVHNDCFHNIVKIVKNIYGELRHCDYDEVYADYTKQIKSALKDDDLEIHHDALRLMLDVIHSYDKHLN